MCEIVTGCDVYGIRAYLSLILSCTAGRAENTKLKIVTFPASRQGLRQRSCLQVPIRCRAQPELKGLSGLFSVRDKVS